MLSQDFVPPVAEGVLRRRIELSDAALVIDRHNAVERRVHDPCLADFTALQFPFLLPEPLFYQSAFSTFLDEFFFGGGRSRSRLHRRLIRWAGDPPLIAQEPGLL